MFHPIQFAATRNLSRVFIQSWEETKEQLGYRSEKLNHVQQIRNESLTFALFIALE